MDIGTYFDRVKQINMDIDIIVKEMLDEVSPDFVKAQISQIRKGRRSDGVMIGTYASKAYEELKRQKYGYDLGGYIDLTFTKQFTENIFARVQGESILFSSEDPKLFILEGFKRWWSDKIFGLSEESISSLSEKSTTILIRKIIERIAK